MTASPPPTAPQQIALWAWRLRFWLATGAIVAAGLVTMELAVLGRWEGVALMAAACLALWAATRAAPISVQTAHTATNTLPAAPTLTDLGPLIDSLPEAALLVDRDGRVIAANSEARRQLQFDAAGVRLSAVMRQPEVLDAVQAAAVDSATRTVEYETASHFEEHFRVYVSPILWNGLSAALAIFNNRTTEINSERMRADFLANASHELKTPVASLSLLVETVAGPARGDEEAQDRFLPMMRQEIDRMRRLIEDLLSLSKIELNEHVPPSDRVDLAEIVADAANGLAALAKAKSVTLELQGLAQAAVVGDAFQLAQVAKNLIENAVKFSPSGSVVTVEIGEAASRDAAIAQSGRRWPQSGYASLLSPPPRPAQGYVYLRVTDAGTGIPRRHLPRLGERFYRVERADGAEKAGTGLGLAIVKHILNRHRAGFLVESEIGVGAAFAAYWIKASTGYSQ